MLWMYSFCVLPFSISSQNLIDGYFLVYLSIFFTLEACMYTYPLVLGSNLSNVFLSLSDLLTLEAVDYVSRISFNPAIQSLLGILELAHLVTRWLDCNHRCVCLTPNMLVYLLRSLLQSLYIHLDLHFHYFCFLYSLHILDLLHYNFRFNFNIPILKSSHYHIWLPFCSWILVVWLWHERPFLNVLLFILLLDRRSFPDGMLILGWWSSITRTESKETLDSVHIELRFYYRPVVVATLLVPTQPNAPPPSPSPSSHVSVLLSWVPSRRNAPIPPPPGPAWLCSPVPLPPLYDLSVR